MSDKWVCINNIFLSNELHITIGKTYTSNINKYPYIYIQNDLGEYHWHDKKLFKKLEDHRDKKLNDLLE